MLGRFLFFLILTTRDQNNGQPYRVALAYRRHGSKYYILSNLDEPPDWLQNIKRDPAVTIQHGSKIVNARATIVDNPDEAMRALYMFRHNFFLKWIPFRKKSADKIDLNTLKEIARQFTVIRIDSIEEPVELPELKPVIGQFGSALIFAALTILIIAGSQILRQAWESEQ